MKSTFGMLLLVALTACTTTSGNSERYWLKADAPSSMDEATALLHYASYARNLSAAERDKELERQRSAYARDKSDARRLQYALLLNSPSEASMSDRRQAQQLIEPLLDGKHDAGLMALAALLNANLNSLMTLSTAQQQSQKRGDELEKKLDAVKDIERSLLRREKGKL